MAVVDSKTFGRDNQKVRQSKGKLIIVKQNGVLIKKYEADAIALGLIKGKPQAENKMRPAPGNKEAQAAEEQPAEEQPKPDDFTTIGIGMATARSLTAHGITTFEQLRTAGPLFWLSENVQEKIDAWRSNG